MEQRQGKNRERNNGQKSKKQYEEETQEETLINADFDQANFDQGNSDQADSDQGDSNQTDSDQANEDSKKNNHEEIIGIAHTAHKNQEQLTQYKNQKDIDADLNIDSSEVINKRHEQATDDVEIEQRKHHHHAASKKVINKPLYQIEQFEHKLDEIQKAIMQYSMSPEQNKELRKLKFISELYIEMITIVYKNYNNSGKKRMTDKMTLLENIMVRLLGDGFTKDLTNTKECFELLGKRIKL